MLGEGGDPRQSGLFPGHRSLPSVQLDDLQLGADPMDLVEEGGHLADGQPVTDRDGVAADIGREGGIEEIPLQQFAADRIRTVEQDEWHPAGGAGFHGFAHGVQVGVEAGSDVLHVEQESIDAVEHRTLQFAG